MHNGHMELRCLNPFILKTFYVRSYVLIFISKNVERLVEYWKTKFDWRAKEKELNSLPHFITQISVEGFDPLDIHFIHQKSEVKGAIPLLFVHGWPGSFLEVTKILPLLKGGDGRPAFHVVAPSLPNYVFSSGVTKVCADSSPRTFLEA